MLLVSGDGLMLVASPLLLLLAEDLAAIRVVFNEEEEDGEDEGETTGAVLRSKEDRQVIQHSGYGDSSSENDGRALLCSKLR